MQLDETRRELAAVRNRIRCVQTDQDVDPVGKCAAYLRATTPLRQKLARLREKYERGEELIAEHEARIEELRQELAVLLEGDRIKKLLRIIKQVNKTDKTAGVKAFVEESFFTSQRVTETRYLMKAWEHEIRYIQKLRTGTRFEKAESEIVKALDAQDRYWDEFAESKRDRDILLDALYERERVLQALVTDMAGDDNARHLVELMKQAQQLAAELGPEKTAFVLNQ